MTTAQNDIIWPTCKCGCGREVPAAKRNVTSRGIRVGDPCTYFDKSCQMAKQTKHILTVVDKVRECQKCHEVKPLQAFMQHAQRKDGFSNTCRDCYNQRARARSLERNPHGDLARKLPGYEQLKAEYLAGGSFLALDRKYGTKKGGARATLKKRATRRNEWPLLTPKQTETRRLAVRDGQKFKVSMLGMRYAIEEHLADTGKTRKEFCEEHGFDRTRINRLLSNKPISFGPALCVRVLEACGEEVRPEIREAAERSGRAV